MFYPLIHLEPFLEITPNSPFVLKNLILRGSILTSIKPLEFSSENKNLIIFIGGFLDSFYRVVFDEYANFTKDTLFGVNFRAKIYTTFKCKALFSVWLGELVKNDFKLYVIAHSWGAKNICRALESTHLPKDSICHLLTLDPVGYYKPKMKFQSVKQWTNVYVADKKKYKVKANFCTYVGKAWDYCESADENIAIYNENLPLITHAEVSSMLEAFKIKR